MKNMDPVKEQKELAAYALFYFFLVSFVLKTVFGVISGSKCLLVAGIASLFGVFIAVVSLIRINRSHPLRTGRLYFNPDKLEFIIVLGASIIITLSTSALLFSVGHMVFFHALYPPQLMAAWAAVITGKLALSVMFWTRRRLGGIPEIDARQVSFALTADFMLSIVTVIAVVVARNGSALLDYACAILTAFAMIIYGVSFLKASFKGLMDASGDESTVAQIKKIIGRARAGMALEGLRVNRAGHLLEIRIALGVTGPMSMKEAAASARKIKDALRRKLKEPHELLVGFKSVEAA